MKKVILAILMVASKEKVVADIVILNKAGQFFTQGSLDLESQSEQQLSLNIWRAGDKSILNLTTDANGLAVNCTEDGKFEIAISGVTITFREPFRQDPFTVNA